MSAEPLYAAAVVRLLDERRQQGFPDRITDPTVLGTVATILSAHGKRAAA